MPKDQLAALIDALNEGAKPDAIASFFGEQGWLLVSENTFRQYIYAFKRVYPELLVGGSAKTLDGIVDPRKPKLDAEAHLEQLIRVGARRLRIGFDFEERTTLLNQNLHKDFRTQGELIEKLVALRNGGTKPGVGRPAQNNAVTSPEAADSLRKVSTNEEKQEKIAGLMTSIVGLMERRKSVETLSTKKKG